ncbi:perforin-1-like [Lepisosteus oculatus]|nr:PREDICTED: perforin-1-like [Lepisosteus oculatus]
MKELVCVLGTLHLLLSPTVIKACTTGTINECKEADYVPGYNFAGEGFDIVKMERKGAYVINVNSWRKKDKTCTLCPNSYLENKAQKLPLTVVDWRTLPHCKMQVTSKMYDSSESFVNNSLSSVENNWKAGLDLSLGTKPGGSLMIGGTHSKAAKYTMEKSKSDKYTFLTHEVECVFYSYRVVDYPKLSKEFFGSLKRLPKVYDHNTKEQYRKLIDTYGTHFIRKVKLGGKVRTTTSVKSCEMALDGFSETEVKDCLDVEASLTAGQRASVKTEYHHCKNDQKTRGTKESFHSTFSERLSEVTGGQVEGVDILFSGDSDPKAFQDWVTSLKTNPDIVSYSLEPMHNLVSLKQVSKKPNLKKAIEEYILEQALYKNCSSKCASGSTPSTRDSCNCVCEANSEVNSKCCPMERGLAKLTVKVEKAAGLWGDHFSQTDAYVKLSYKNQNLQTRVIYDQNNPVWQESLYFGTVKLTLDSTVNIEVWDEDKMWYKWWNDILGKCSIKLQRGSRSDMCTLNHGTLYFSYTVECAPGLGGTTCTDYIPSPMSPSLAKTFASRNAVSMSQGLLDQLRAGHSMANSSCYT